MRKSETHSLKEVVNDYIDHLKIGGKLKETQLLSNWEKIMGKTIAKKTQKIYIKDRVLYISLTSSVLRNELFMMRSKLKERLNESVGAEVLKDIVLR